MRIAFCCVEWEPVAGGGIRTYVEGVTARLARRGHQPHVITYDHEDTGSDEVRDGVIVHRVRFTRLQGVLHQFANRFGMSEPTFRVFYAIQVARKVRELTRAGAIDAVESPDYAAEGLALTFLQRRFRAWRVVPHVVMLHTPMFVLNEINGGAASRSNRWCARLENWNLRRVRHLSSPSRALSKRVADGLALKQPIWLDPYPSDVVGNLGATEKKPPHREGEPIDLLYVGRMEHRKGVTFLVDALNALGPKYPQLRAELVGGDTETGPDHGSMREHLVERLAPEMTERVRFVDRVAREDLFSRYREAAFCVFPSVFENFANTCLEAISSGCVVVVPRDSGMAEMVQDGVTGFVFENCNTEDLIRAIEECLAQRPRWPEMGRLGREFLAKEFDPETLVNRKLSHYATLSA